MDIMCTQTLEHHFKVKIVNIIIEILWYT